MSSFSSFFLCFLIDSCVLIVDSLEIVCAKQPHCNGATNRERKLTKTLFIVTVVSSLLTLALIIFRICYEVPLCRYSKNYFASKNRSVILFFVFVFVFLFHANSLINPNIGNPAFKRALFSFLYCISQTQSAEAFPLNEK